MNARFVIVNTTDAPQRRLVAEWVEGLGYCYMSRTEDKRLKDFDGMNPTRPTPIEQFGFAVRVADGNASFHRVSDSTATYEDGEPRKWQDVRHAHTFTLPLVSKASKRGKAINPKESA